MIPKYANIVVFFGDDSLTRLESMLRYYSTALTEEAWQSFLFILATPNGQNVTSLSSALPFDIPDHIRSRCYYGLDQNAIIYQETLAKIQSMYRNNKLLLHLICDDFASARFPATAPSVLTDIIRQHLGDAFTFVPYYYFILHARKAAETSRQRALLESLQKYTAQNYTQHAYLLSRKQDDNSLASEDNFWRALMCEILIISFGRRTHLSGMFSSLGYTSLNANEQELIDLRKHHLLSLLQDTCDSQYEDDMAWKDLLFCRSSMPDRQNITSVTDFLLNWLRDRISEDMISPTDEQIKNFRTLTCALSRENPDDLLDNAKHFFEINLRYKYTAQDKRPEQISSERYYNKLLAHLSTRPNLCNFPDSVISLLLLGLEQLLSYSPKNSEPQYQPENFAQKNFPPAHRNYMIKCCEQAENTARNHIVESLVRAYAKAYGNMFLHIRNNLLKTSPTRPSTIHTIISDQELPSSSLESLQRKYPSYSSNITQILQVLKSPFSCKQFYNPKTLAPEKEWIHNALEDAVKQLADVLSRSYGFSFISAIEHEFSIPGAMDKFLSSYLTRSRRLFHNITAPAEAPDEIRYFCSNEFSSTNKWVSENRENTIFVMHDNIQRLDHFPLNLTFSDFLSEENLANPYNEYFWQPSSSEETIILPTAPTLQDAAAFLPSSPQNQIENTSLYPTPNSRSITMRLDKNTDGKSMQLSWGEWQEATEEYCYICINNEKGEIRLPINRKAYNTSPIGVQIGLDQISSGKNTITIKSFQGRLIAQQDFNGPQLPIDYYYRSDSCTLYLAHATEGAISSLVISEKIRMRDQDGNEVFSDFFYPLSARNATVVRGVICYEGLTFKGNWKLICDPRIRFCSYIPNLNPNLTANRR